MIRLAARVCFVLSLPFLAVAAWLLALHYWLGQIAYRRESPRR